MITNNFIPLLHGIDIGGMIKKLFGFKRFASVEFTAKQAFENIDVAMILFQILLLFTIFAGGWYFIAWIFAEKRRKSARQLGYLVHRLAAENLLLLHQKDISNADKQALLLSKKDTIVRIKQILAKPFVKTILSKHHMKIILTMLDAFEKNLLGPQEQSMMISHLSSLFKKV